jgi:predicted 2-oxoglutarate/Fe(II)-dependent dioxygenase YbiX
MNDQKKCRVVTFRLSEPEYEALKSACGEEKNTISSVARQTVVQWAQSLASEPKVHERLNEMDNKLDTLIGLFHNDPRAGAGVH